MNALFTCIDYVQPASVKNNLQHYKYHCVDRSLLAKHVGQPFWRFCVELVPLWMAPNLITLIGLAFMLFGYAVVYAHLPHLQYAPLAGEPPRWIWLNAAACVFLYQTLDAIDGKQARRTGSSSALGELFDHGCDAISTALVSLMVSAALQYTWYENAIVIVFACATFYLGQWEEYHTGEMYLGVFNVTEALVGVELVLLCTGLFGPAQMRAWHVHTLMFWAAVLLGVYTDYVYVSSVLRHSTTPRARLKSLQLLAPALVLLGGATLWAFQSRSRVAQHYPYAFANIVGLNASALVGRLVLARIVRESVSAWQWCLLPFVLVVLNDCLLPTPLLPVHTAIGALVAFSVLAYLHFAMYVIVTLCKALNINCLSIATTQKKTK